MVTQVSNEAEFDTALADTTKTVIELTTNVGFTQKKTILRTLEIRSDSDTIRTITASSAFAGSCVEVKEHLGVRPVVHFENLEFKDVSLDPPPTPLHQD